MMRLPEFRYRTARHLSEAAAWLAQDPAHTLLLAGGTDVLPNMKRRQQTPTTLVGLRGISELTAITQGEDLRIGAGVTLAALASNAAVRSRAVGLAQAAAYVATPHIRNMATIGGNVCLDTRCTYYNQSYEWRKSIDFCKKKDGTTCWVATSSPKCLAVSSTDTAPVLQALDARVTLLSVDGTRVTPIGDLFANDGIAYLTKRRNEIITAISLVHGPEWRSAYWKLRRRGSFDFPVAAAAVAARFDGARVIGAQIVLGAVASRPLTAEKAGAMLIGQVLSDEAIVEASRTAAEIAKPMDNTDFELVWRKRMVRTLVANALREVRGDDMRNERVTLGRLAWL